ncbi:hypothetical protein RB195_012097 [Necator americanus]|uniref:Uncharacterized protein n=1 Tax=Necator americanus TaxID=51031 RepID=A0ABR1D5H4_NECAM
MVRRACYLCHQCSNVAFSRWSSQTRKQLAVLLCGFMLFVGGNFEEMKTAYDVMKERRRRICDIHFIETAQRMTDEITSRGGSLLRSEDDGRTYVSKRDIPPQLIANLQDVLNGFDDGSLFSDVDVQTFVNECLSRYYNGEVWMGPDLQFPKSVQPMGLKRVEEASVPSGPQFVPSTTPPPTKRPKIELEFVEKRESTSESSFVHSVSSESITIGSFHAPNKDTSTSSFDPWDICELPSQDNDLLRKHFMVEGEQLLQLFRFCPQCGQKIPEGNTVRLLEHGNVPIVQFLCKNCSRQGEPVKRWEGQKRAVDHHCERHSQQQQNLNGWRNNSSCF